MYYGSHGNDSKREVKLLLIDVKKHTVLPTTIIALTFNKVRSHDKSKRESLKCSYRHIVSKLMTDKRADKHSLFILHRCRFLTTVNTI